MELRERKNKQRVSLILLIIMVLQVVLPTVTSIFNIEWGIVEADDSATSIYEYLEKRP